ncbi:MAG: cation diffusion facilitator family transporter [Bdellovibrionales bacterium]
MAADGSTKVVISAVAGNSFVTLIKLQGWIVSGSPSMLAEAIHSLADTFNQFLLFIGIKQGQRMPSRAFPRGYGQSRYLWNLISAVGIFFVGFGVTTYHGIHSLLYPEPPSAEIWLPLGILIAALIIESIPLQMAIKEVIRQKNEMSFEYLRTSDDPTTLGVLFEDGIAVFGVTLALAGVYFSQHFNSNLPDAIAAILIGLLLGIMAVALAFINGRFLIGRALPRAKEEEMKKFIRQIEYIEKIVKFETEVLAPGRCHMHLEVELHGGVMVPREEIEKDVQEIRNGELPAKVLVETAERMVRIVGNNINEIESKIRKQYPEVVSIALEIN